MEADSYEFTARDELPDAVEGEDYWGLFEQLLAVIDVGTIYQAESETDLPDPSRSGIPEGFMCKVEDEGFLREVKDGDWSYLAMRRTDTIEEAENFVGGGNDGEDGGGNFTIVDSDGEPVESDEVLFRTQ